MNLELIAQAFPLVMGPLVAGLVEVGKRVPVIPFDGTRRLQVVAALLVVSLLVRVALAWATDTLGSFDWEGELRIVFDAVVAALVAAGGYSLAKKG